MLSRHSGPPRAGHAYLARRPQGRPWRPPECPDVHGRLSPWRLSLWSGQPFGPYLPLHASSYSVRALPYMRYGLQQPPHLGLQGPLHSESASQSSPTLEIACAVNTHCRRSLHELPVQSTPTPEAALLFWHWRWNHRRCEALDSCKSSQVKSSQVKSRRVTSSHATSRHVTSRCVTSRHVTRSSSPRAQCSSS